ncbi:FKBP-type peptidyl-prolyl cis-trans isomerase [Pseudomonas mangiferae]|uniref:Peptidyl-prolyl cis-trans isomerase n=1 Tax=Pseudomonas mangiferae TaxID=2593654 RepID=A0A553H0D5_9PSED|nr:FKBP-type peptidyl-prolyl cis-trans isomerase [Pseudomonas mangiferae]TRX75214.1 FKBP-type peptidyl-prolyl cis-trans isomerase [Pseudomonas mangiferae]
MRRSLLSIALLTSLAGTAVGDDAHDLSYSLGVRLGERLREEVPDLQVEALLKGLRQAYRGEPLELPAARIKQLQAAHEARMVEAERLHTREIAAETRFLVAEKAKPGVRELAGGVLITELQKGNGGRPRSGGEVRVRYTGQLADGSVFDASPTPAWFKLDSVIAGWRMALLEMPMGAKWRVVIPSAQAYGTEGAGDLIPPYAPLVFEIELLDGR